MSVYFFFFKQKTAYDMRISDWSSDVCSSDLEEICRIAGPERPRWVSSAASRKLCLPDDAMTSVATPASAWKGRMSSPKVSGTRAGRGSTTFKPNCRATRSEEHTSELQSLMRISYAVFCLNTKKETDIQLS